MGAEGDYTRCVCRFSAWHIMAGVSVIYLLLWLYISNLFVNFLFSQTLLAYRLLIHIWTLSLTRVLTGKPVGVGMIKNPFWAARRNIVWLTFKPVPLRLEVTVQPSRLIISTNRPYWYNSKLPKRFLFNRGSSTCFYYLKWEI